MSKGLARLEDLFYQCSGRELSLYWHAPHNKADDKIRDEGTAAGYQYVDFNDPKVIQIKAAGSNMSGPRLYEKFDLMVNEIFTTGAEIVPLNRLR